MKLLDRIILILVLITIIGATIFLYKGFKSTTVMPTDTLERKIDSLNSKKNSIKVDINKCDTAIYYNKTIYVKEKDNIIKQSPDSDMQFFTNYIREVGRKLLIDTVSIKITNLIFNEHKYLLVNDSLQKIQINNYKSLVNTLDSTLTYKDYQIKIQSNKNNELYIQNKKLSKLNYLFGGISILSIICALIH